MSDFVLATANEDKAREIRKILGDAVMLRPRPDEVPEVEESGKTLAENSRLKARALVEATGLAAIADDTGLEVEALDGAPGVFSARFAGPKASYRENVEKLIRCLEGVREPRTARFRTVAVACWPNGREALAEGCVLGEISSCARGTNGFGYDSVFIPDAGDGRTFAEMSSSEKNRFSHRGAAFRALAKEIMT